MVHFALIVPLNEECNIDDNAYIIPIDDEQTWEMANGVEGFSFYVMEVNEMFDRF